MTARVFPHRFMAQARFGSVIYSTDRETRLVRYLLHLFLLKKSTQKQSFRFSGPYCKIDQTQHTYYLRDIMRDFWYAYWSRAMVNESIDHDVK